MTEQLISLETYTVAQNKGFNVRACRCGGYPECICDLDSKPTQSLLQKWLREAQDIHIELGRAKFLVSGKSYYCYFIYDEGQEEHIDTGFDKVLDLAYGDDKANHEEQALLFDVLMIEHGVAFETYEQALEAGLLEALKLIS